MILQRFVSSRFVTFSNRNFSHFRKPKHSHFRKPKHFLDESLLGLFIGGAVIVLLFRK